MTQMYIVRHGDYIHSEEPPYDLGLSPDGILQAQKLRDRLERENFDIDVLISSSMKRAIQTAEILSSVLKLQIEIEPDLDEWHNQGENGLTQDELVSQLNALPADQHAFISPSPGLETWGEFGFRVCNALNRICQKHANKSIAIIAHGGTIEASFVYCYGVSPLAAKPFMMMLGPANTSITHWRYIHKVNVWRLEKHNDTCHLNETPNY